MATIQGDGKSWVHNGCVGFPTSVDSSVDPRIPTSAQTAFPTAFPSAFPSAYPTYILTTSAPTDLGFSASLFGSNMSPLVSGGLCVGIIALLSVFVTVGVLLFRRVKGRGAAAPLVATIVQDESLCPIAEEPVFTL